MRYFYCCIVDGNSENGFGFYLDNLPEEFEKYHTGFGNYYHMTFSELDSIVNTEKVLGITSKYIDKNSVIDIDISEEWY